MAVPAYVSTSSVGGFPFLEELDFIHLYLQGVAGGLAQVGPMGTASGDLCELVEAITCLCCSVFPFCEMGIISVTYFLGLL